MAHSYLTSTPNCEVGGWVEVNTIDKEGSILSDNKQTRLFLRPENGDDVPDDRTEGEATYEDNHGLQVHDASSATVRKVRPRFGQGLWIVLSQCQC